MPLTFSRYSSIALVKEIESPENPGGLEKRVALVPSDVGQLVEAGITVYVKIGAGEGVGFCDEKLIDGLGQLKPGVERALVCGPF